MPVCHVPGPQRRRHCAGQPQARAQIAHGLGPGQQGPCVGVGGKVLCQEAGGGPQLPAQKAVRGREVGGGGGGVFRGGLLVVIWAVVG